MVTIYYSAQPARPRPSRVQSDDRWQVNNDVEGWGMGRAAIERWGVGSDSMLREQDPKVTTQESDLSLRHKVRSLGLGL